MLGVRVLCVPLWFIQRNPPLFLTFRTTCLLAPLAGDAKFFSMEENDWGFSEPRVLTFSKDDKSLHIIDATAAGTGTSEFTLRRIMRVSLHAGDKSTAQLSISDGGVVATVTKRVVLSFGGKALRDRFVGALYPALISAASSSLSRAHYRR